mgnify:CR=1 FL=1
MNILHKGRNVETRILLQESLPQPPVSQLVLLLSADFGSSVYLLFGAFGNFARRARQDVCESRETALWQFSRIFEQRLGDVENLAIAISKLSEVNTVRRVGREVTGMDVYKIYLLQRSMHAIRMQQSFIQSIYIYLDSP